MGVKRLKKIFLDRKIAPKIGGRILIHYIFSKLKKSDIIWFLTSEYLSTSHKINIFHGSVVWGNYQIKSKLLMLTLKMPSLWFQLVFSKFSPWKSSVLFRLVWRPLANCLSAHHFCLLLPCFPVKMTNSNATAPAGHEEMQTQSDHVLKFFKRSQNSGICCKLPQF